MKSLKRSLLIITLLVSYVGCDQVTKDLARQVLAFEPPISWFNDIVRLEYAENPGAFLGVGMGLPEEIRFLVFQVMVGVGLIGILIFLLFVGPRSSLLLVGWCLLLGGGGSNLLDRILHHGQVIDFMNLGIGSLRTGIFNVADVFITISVVLLLVEFLRHRHQPVIE